MRFAVHPSVWQAWCLAALTLVLMMALESDLRERRVPNVLVLLALCTGFALSAWGPEQSGGGIFSSDPGALGATSALLGALVGLLVFIPFYWLHAMGAGDVKLMAALGSFTGPAEAISLALCILVAGGVLAVLRMLWIGKSAQVFGNVKTVLQGWGQGGSHGFDPATQTADRMPYAMAFAGGFVGYSWWRLSGGAAIIGA
jgi:prepilin peptidase CpaA